MVRLNQLIQKISEARTYYSPFGGKSAIDAFRLSQGEFRPTNSAVNRFQAHVSWGIGPEGRNSRLSTDRTNRGTLNDIGTSVSELVSSGKIPPRERNRTNRKTRITEEQLRIAIKTLKNNYSQSNIRSI